MKPRLNEVYFPRNFEVMPDMIKLYHGTDIYALEEIFYDGFISARNGRQHGETSGMNWFSLKASDNFNRGVLFSITVPKNDFINGKFRFMNDGEVTSSENEIEIGQYDLKIVKIGGVDLAGFEHLLHDRCNDDIYDFVSRINNFSILRETDLYIDSPIVVNLLKQIVGMDYLRREGIVENVLHEVSASDLNLSSFKVRDELNPKFWVNGKLNSKVRLRLLDIVDDFIKELSINVDYKDIVFTGSLANYNWSKYSDIDIHVIYDFSEIYKDEKFVEDYFYSKKELWKNSHDTLKIYGFPVEISVENSNGEVVSSGIYSLDKNKWVVEPDNFDDVRINEKYIKKHAADIMTEIDKFEKVIEKEKDNHKIEVAARKVKGLFDKLKKMRKESLSRSGEMSSGNIIWKLLRRTGYLDKMWDIIDCSYNKINSLKESYHL